MARTTSFMKHSLYRNGSSAGGPLQVISFAGRNGAGAITYTGLGVGDKVYSVNNTTDHATALTSFENTITVADQIQQSSASNLTTKVYHALIKKA